MDGTAIVFDDGVGYHDHNWGFWKDVSWRWGQVQHGDLSLVYGRIRPPADAADAERIPGFLAAIGPDGPIGYATNVSIEETNDTETGHPRTHRGDRPQFFIGSCDGAHGGKHARHQTGNDLFGGGLDFLQLRASYRVSGRAGDRSIDFTAAGTAETFRGR